MIFEFQSKLIIITRNSPDKSTQFSPETLLHLPSPRKRNCLEAIKGVTLKVSVWMNE